MANIKYEVSQLSISFLTRLPVISILPGFEDENEFCEAESSRKGVLGENNYRMDL